MSEPPTPPPDNNPSPDEAGMLLRLLAMFFLGISIGVTLTMMFYESGWKPFR